MSDTTSKSESSPASEPVEQAVVPAPAVVEKASPGRPALDPTRYGDWEKNGRCIDF